MTMKLTPPAPLDNTKIHTREQYKNWQNEMFSYYKCIRDEEEAAETKAAAALLESQREMTDTEYFAMARRRYEAQKARDAEREKQRQQAEEEKAAYLASLPDVAVISESNPVCFVQQIMYWTKQGYTLAENAEVDILFGLHRVCLDKPAPAKKVK